MLVKSTPLITSIEAKVCLRLESGNRPTQLSSLRYPSLWPHLFNLGQHYFVIFVFNRCLKINNFAHLLSPSLRTNLFCFDNFRNLFVSLKSLLNIDLTPPSIRSAILFNSEILAPSIKTTIPRFFWEQFSKTDRYEEAITWQIHYPFGSRPDKTGTE